MTDRAFAQAKRADLAASTGALVAGIAIGLVVGDPPPAFAAALFVAGAGLHASGMSTKHRLERDAGVRPPIWATALTAVCWIALAAVSAILVVRAFA